jgi:acetyl esterase/lipase
MFAHEEDITKLKAIAQELKAIRTDAFILSDPGIFMILKEQFPMTEFHLSTQANTLNSSAIEFWRKQGISRVIYEYFDVYIKPRLLAQNNHTSPDMKKSIASEKYVSWDLLPMKYLEDYKKINDKYGEDRSIVEKRRVLFTPEVSPLLANDYTLQHMPQTYLVTAEYDPFRDDGLIYAERLRQAGVPIELKHYEHGYHGALYFISNDNFELPKRIFDDLVLYVNKNL